ncbi:molybdenum cofactor guanylyltransferase [Pedococcus bigeumensis]|uniref:molybdenum cofactor guanylyltransferase n=1 Tax=Pedococcus bigeumensis TaxID=433644 RepID=UPI00138732BB|nr:molybdenum cofactor guanylyltransferase [Pedococcus bigeumensis]
MSIPSVTAIVLCGGAGRRFGGDKTRADLAGSPVLDHVLDGLPSAWPVVCVGDPRPTARPVAWCREDPPGGGPVAAIAAALPHVDSPVVVVLGGDMPYAASPAPDLASRLAVGPGLDVVLGRDGDGRLQPLLAAYRTEALCAALPKPAAGTPLMRLLDSLRTLVVALPEGAALDVDTTADLDRARRRPRPTRHRLDP